MKKICLIVIVGLLGREMCSAQRVDVYYGDFITYSVAQPTYLFQKDCPSSNMITITKDVFLQYIDSVCINSSPSDTNVFTEIVPGMIQIIYIKSPRKYYTINMTRSIAGTTIKKGFLEIDGEIKNYIFSFQEIMDEIVNYHIHFPRKNVDDELFLSEILKGKRRKLTH